MDFWRQHKSYEIVRDALATPYTGKHERKEVQDSPCGVLFSGIAFNSYADSRTGGGIDFYYEAELASDVLELKKGTRVLRAAFDFLANSVTFLLQHKTITFDGGESLYIEETESSYTLFGDRRKIKEVTALKFERYASVANDEQLEQC
jgi:hypothetical protein